jgi:hypothetical protein
MFSNRSTALFLSFLGLLLPVLAQYPQFPAIPYDPSPFTLTGAITG